MDGAATRMALVGIALVKEAMAPQWAELSPFARLVLVHMATTALDHTVNGLDPRLYYAGHGPLCLFVAGVGEEAGTAYSSALRRVRRAIKELTEAGAIVQARPAVNGRNAVYELNTSSIPLPVDNQGREGGEGGPKGRTEEDTSVLLRRTPVSYPIRGRKERKER